MKAGVHVEPIGTENLDRVLACNDRWYAAKTAKGKSAYHRVPTVRTFENLSRLEPLGVWRLAVMLDDDVRKICESWDLTHQTLSDRILSDVLGCSLSSRLENPRAWARQAVKSRSRAAVRQRRRA